MQDRYAGDIGDFGKFQLLRLLFKHTSYKLTQLWFKYPDESHNSDGLHINYFDKVKRFDSILEEKLLNISQNNRSIKALEEAELLINISYFSKEIPFSLEDRKEWFTEAMNTTLKSDFILTDSDNGIATKFNKKLQDIELMDYSLYNKRVKQGKYIFLDEIDALYDFKASLIIYHHLNRTMAHDKQITILLENLNSKYKNVIAIKHKPYSPRVYFILCQNGSIYKELKDKLTIFELDYSLHWKLFHLN